jgi:undecaprenyl-diphosphatase
MVERPRPSHNPEMAGLVHIVNDYRGGQFGFVSSHAANFFGVATFLSSQFKNYKWSFVLLGWAALISYSRIYLGVHYPLDIICGAVLGAVIGIQCFVFKIWTVVYFEKYIEDRKSKRRRNQRIKKSEKDRYEQIMKNK